MSKYIDAGKLKAEIERRNLSNRYITTKGYEEELYEIIDSLQQEQPEVDLKEEIKKEMVKLPFFIRGKDQIAFARHFYELGLNARKEA